MKYLLPEYDIERFDQLSDLVHLCYYDPLNNRWGFPGNKLTQIGTSTEGLSTTDVYYIESYGSPVDRLNGVCFHGKDTFKVWLHPDLLAGDRLLFELTLLHELCHGYIGPCMHSKAWRRFFGRVVLLYGELINPSYGESDPEWQVKHNIRRYWGEENPKASYNECVEQSRLELETVVKDVEQNHRRITYEFHQFKEVRKACPKSSSNSTPTPAYLALQLKKAGTGLR